MGMIIQSPGLLTTIQDQGRFGMAAYGITSSGAMDARAMELANLIAGNDRETPIMELTLLGPDIVCTKDCIIAITGADMQAMLNCKRISRYEPITVKAGDRLTFAYANSGCRAYLAVAGGFQVPSSYGSYSTNLRCGFGGFYGRALKSGDEIPFHQAEGLKKWRRLSDKWIKEEKDYIEQKEDIIRVVMGPQNAAFTKKGIHTFLSESYEISNESDRMGCRLLGDKIEAKHGYDIISDATAMGTIQVTNKGLPIVMLSDRQTTGGYAKIATIIQSDLPRLVQKKPGDKVKFRRISVDAARRIYKKEQKRINEWISKEG